MADLTMTAYRDAYAFWSQIYTPKSKVNWLLMSEKDWDCWYSKTIEFEGPTADRGVWNKSTGILGHCTVGVNAFCGYGTGVRENGVFAQYNLIGSEYNEPPTPMTVHHETAHIYQMQVMSDNYLTSKKDTIACWFIEGQANLFGMAIASKGVTTTNRNFELSRLLKVYPGGSSFTQNQWLEVLNVLKSNYDFCFKNELGYSLGWLALEWTYMNYSIEQMHTFLESISKSLTWSEAIQTHLKMDEQGYLTKIAEYLEREV